MNKYKELFKNVGILTLSNFASKIMVFLLVPLYTSVLSTEEYGTYDLVVSTVQLLFPLLTLNISDAVMRFSMDKSSNNEEVAYIGFRYIFLSFIPAILFVFITKKISIFNNIHGMETLIILYFIFYVFNQFLIQLAKGKEKIMAMGIAGILGTIFLIGGNIILLFVFKNGLVGFFIANILSQFVPSIYLLTITKGWKYFIPSRINKQLRNEMLRYSMPLIFTTVGWWVNNASDKYVVAFICGTAANGLLSVAYKIPSIINTLQSIFIQAWQISAIKEYGNDNTKYYYGKMFQLLNVLMSAACSWLILLSIPIAKILYAKDFYSAWHFVPFLLISSVINSASGFIGPILAAKKDSKSMAMSAVYGASANVAMNVIFVFLIGVQGATIATAISSLIIYLVRIRAAKNEIFIKKYGFVLLTWVLLCVQAFVCIYTNAWPLELVLMITMVFVNRREIKTIIGFLSGMVLKLKN